MGVIRHNSLIVTSRFSEDGRLQKLHEYAVSLFGHLVTPVISSGLNGYKYFFVAPDGSNEGWAESNDGNDKRSALCDYIDSLAYEDGSNAFKYVDVAHGEDDSTGIENAEIERTNYDDK